MGSTKTGCGSDSAHKHILPKEFRWSLGQDGRLGRPGVHISPQVHQEYIYKWNNSHRTPHEH